MSARYWLGTHFIDDEVCTAVWWHELLAIPRDQIAAYRLIMGHFYNLIYQILPRPPLTITFLREPVARAVSNYRHLWRDNRHYYHERAHRLGDLLSFLRDPGGSALCSNMQTRMLAFDPDIHDYTATLKFPAVEDSGHNLEVASALSLTDDEVLARAKARLDSFAFVGLTEQLHQSLRGISGMFGWWPPQTVPNENITPTDQDYGQITPDALELLREMNRLDAELYRYAEQRFAADSSRLTMNLLEERAITANLNSTRMPFLLEFSDLVPGAGWHTPERDSTGHCFRWLGPDTHAVLYLLLPTDREALLECRIHYTLAEDILFSLAIIVEGQPLQLRFTSEDGHMVRAVIPAGTANANQPSEVIFAVNRTAVPHQLDAANSDRRALGLAFSWLRVW